MPVYTASACGSTIDVSLNSSFVLELDENPTTGYRWDFEVAPGLEIQFSNFSLSQGGGAGGGGVRELVLRADRTGSFALKGRLLRLWLGDSSTIMRCEIIVRVS